MERDHNKLVLERPVSREQVSRERTEHPQTKAGTPLTDRGHKTPKTMSDVSSLPTLLERQFHSRPYNQISFTQAELGPLQPNEPL